MIKTTTIPLDSSAPSKLEALLKKQKTPSSLIAEFSANKKSMEVSVISQETRRKVLKALAAEGK